MNPTPQPNRRQFLQKSVAASVGAISVPYIVSPSALGLDNSAAPSDRIVMGCVGTGGKGRDNMRTFLSFKDVQVVAVCDVDAGQRNQARDAVNRKYGNEDCATYGDFRELVNREDIDAVSVATPDHWHALPTIAALNSGKDVYCEKPLANSIEEGRAICDAAKKNDRIVQTGSHERSSPKARFACELVRNGRIGKLHTLCVQLPCDQEHHQKVMAQSNVPAEQPVPEGLDFDMWLGHTPKTPYRPFMADEPQRRCHFWWRFILAYGGGEMTDRGAHVIDLGELGAGKDGTGPTEIEAKGTQSTTSLYDAYFDYLFINKFADGLTLIGDTSKPRGVRFEGTDGWIFIHVHGCRLEAEPAFLLEEKIDDLKIRLGRSPSTYDDRPLPANGHHRNFIDCVKSRQQPMATAEIGHRTGTICHLNNISMKLGRKLRWDPVAEKVLDDDEANELLTPQMRKPWAL